MIIRPLPSAATLVWAALLAAAAAPRGAPAQSPPSAAPAAPAAPAPAGAAPCATRAVSVSPLLALFGSTAGDYEQRVGEHLSLGVGAQYDSKNSVLFSGASGYDFDASVKLRYYPASSALDGPSIGVLAGGTRYERPRTGSPDGVGASERAHSVPTLGVTVDYNHLFGAGRHFLVGTGTGVKRRFVRGGSDLDRLTAVRPTVRLAFGYAW